MLQTAKEMRVSLFCNRLALFIVCVAGPSIMAKLKKRNRRRRTPVFSRTEQRAIILEGLRILPNVWQVYRCLGKRIGVSYGTIWNVAKAEGIELIGIDRRRLIRKSGAA